MLEIGLSNTVKLGFDDLGYNEPQIKRSIFSGHKHFDFILYSILVSK